MSTEEKLSLRLLRNREGSEGSQDKSASGMCGKCSQTFQMSELGRLKGFKGLVCKKCMWADFMQMVTIALRAAIVLRVVLFILAKK